MINLSQNNQPMHSIKKQLFLMSNSENVQRQLCQKVIVGMLCRWLPPRFCLPPMLRVYNAPSYNSYRGRSYKQMPVGLSTLNVECSCRMARAWCNKPGLPILDTVFPVLPHCWASQRQQLLSHCHGFIPSKVLQIKVQKEAAQPPGRVVRSLQGSAATAAAPTCPVRPQSSLLALIPEGRVT